MDGFFDMFLGGLPPHGYCLLWWPQLVWTHVVADALIALAYFSIPLALIRFVRRRTDIAFGGIFWLFALFITACGATHVMSIWTLWNGDYGVEALLKVFTAIVSVLTAVLLWPLIPRALAIPSSSQLRLANEELAARVAERDMALEALRLETAERRRAESALFQAQKIEAIGQLTGGIAHDFNNLLQAAAGNIELISRHVQDQTRLSRWTANASAALERGKKLTGQLLAFSRTQKLELRPVPLRAAILETMDMLGRTLGPQVTLEPDLGTGDWHVLADPTQLELALMNLAINARDAMPEGGTLRIATRPVHIAEAAPTPTATEAAPDSGSEPADSALPPGHYVDIIVSDTGIGMPPAVRERAFDPFFTTKDMGRGTGLGLSMVFGVARQSGGTATLDSREGGGTSVTVRLRRVDPVDIAAPPGGLAPDGHDADRLDGIAILLVDDDDDVRAALADMLEHQGAQVTQADSGARGVAIAHHHRPDAVVLDFAMPGMTGAEVATRLVQLHPGLPIVIASGYADSAALRAAMGDSIITVGKPFRQQALVAAIRQAMARAGARAGPRTAD